MAVLALAFLPGKISIGGYWVTVGTPAFLTAAFGFFSRSRASSVQMECVAVRECACGGNLYSAPNR